MSSHPFKNYLRTCRKGLGLDQSHLATLLGLKAKSRISAMESGKALPTVRECVAFQVLFNRSFEEMWPRMPLELEMATEENVQRLMVELLKRTRRSNRKTVRATVIRTNLQSILDRISTEDITDAL